MSVSISRHLYIDECPNTGSVCVLFADWSNSQLEHLQGAFAARTFAHDFVEHVNGPWNMGTLQDELEAIGGFIYNQMPNSEGGVSDLIAMLDYCEYRKIPTRGEPPVVYSEFDGWVEAVISRFIASVFIEIDADRLEKVAKYFEYHLKVGINKAHELYGCPNVANAIWVQAQAAFEELDKFGLESLFGERFTLTVDADGYKIDGLPMLNDDYESDYEDEDMEYAA